MISITIRLPDHLVEELLEDESSIYKILKLGLKQLKIEKAVERYKKRRRVAGKSSGVSRYLYQGMIPIVYAHGLEPKYDCR